MIALIAGTGALPGILAEALVAAGDPPVICEILGFEPDVRPDLLRLRFRIETLGTLLATLKQLGVSQICMAGAVRRPVIDAGKIDAATQPLISPLMAAMAKGDDGTLRGVIAIFEGQGFTVIGADQIAAGLLPTAGILTRVGPMPHHMTDAAVGFAEIARMGQADIGQACIVQGGTVIMRETEAGTDIMITRSRLVAPPNSQDRVLVKAPKPNQDRRADLPVIGPLTAGLAAEAGLAGIVIQAGGVIVIDLAEVIAKLDKQAMFLWVRP
jgi:UDP-2,3-diacylglucosamine hydrolase